MQKCDVRAVNEAVRCAHVLRIGFINTILFKIISRKSVFVEDSFFGCCLKTFFRAKNKEEVLL